MRGTPFPESILREAASLSLSESLFRGRREVQGVTIDKLDHMDLDDAIWVRRLPEGRYKLEVSIADVTAVIPKDSEVDREAHTRATSLYWNEGKRSICNPMMPQVLSEGILSLLQDQRRPTITVSMTFGPDFRMEGLPVVDRTWLTNRHMYTYSDVNSIFNNGLHPMHGFFQLAHEVADGLQSRRRIDGALTFFHPFKENERVRINEEGTVMRVSDYKSISQHIIEELMIATNKGVAAIFRENDVNALFRIHLPKLPEEEVRAIYAEFEGLEHAPSSLEVKALRRRIAHALERAEYSHERREHVTLGIRDPDTYLHFTSPIRRRADMINHWQLIALVEGGTMLSPRQLETMASYITEKSREAKRIENDKLKAQRYRPARKALLANDPSKLVNGDFTRLLKLASRNGGMTDEVTDEIIKRIKGRRINEVDLFTVLFEQKAEPELWTRAREHAFSFMLERPNYASYMYNIAVQIYDWPKIEFNLEKINNPVVHAYNAAINFLDKQMKKVGLPSPKRFKNFPKFSISANVTIEGVQFSTSFVERGYEKGLKQRATVNILSQMILGQEETVTRTSAG